MFAIILFFIDTSSITFKLTSLINFYGRVANFP